MLATAYARNVWGVRTAYNRSELIAPRANYQWTATSDGSGRMRLAGDVPSERARRALIDTAKAAFLPGAVTDDMRLARGSIDRESWLAGAQFSLKTLAELKKGEAQLSALDLSMRGEAATSRAYREVRAALANRRPSGIGLAHEEIAPPVAKPYVWDAKKESRRFRRHRLCANRRFQKQTCFASRVALRQSLVCRSYRRRGRRAPGMG